MLSKLSVLDGLEPILGRSSRLSPCKWRDQKLKPKDKHGSTYKKCWGLTLRIEDIVGGHLSIFVPIRHGKACPFPPCPDSLPSGGVGPAR